MNTTMKTCLAGFIAVAASVALQAQEEAGVDDLEVVEVNSLDELLQNVEERRVVESQEHLRREAEFQARKDQQARMLADARAEKRAQERRSERLETTFEENEIRIGQMQEQYDKRLGSLRELFGVLQQVSGDTRAKFQDSLVSAQMPNRGDWLNQFAAKMGKATQLATIDEMEQLWFLLQQEMTESGRVTRFTGTVNMLDGRQVETDLVRVGAFAIVGAAGYINYDINLSALVELGRQPEAQYAATAENLFEAADGELVSFAVDPTRGSLISLLIQKATLGEMVGTPFGGFTKGQCYLPFCDGQGDYPGSIIILVGIIGVLMAIERLIALTIVGAKVTRQRNNPGAPSEDNPLGRVVKVYEDNKEVDTETLSLKLGEAILTEMPALTRSITIIQVISIVAPLMGLLGTVIGMIETFQSITLFGAGDPKTMASGISTALMTTVLGLCVAIPTTLLHAIVNQRSRSIIHVLEEQSEGIVAMHAEESGRPLD
ncbi:MAG: MotA/TolQ/ExbB proton channel family protein [Gammaproteobacteria bacterium]|nr:MotA/TolQ/ExbB proton channel family protein [Gammaproteobacteria bacterium]